MKFALNDQNVSEEVLDHLRQTLIAANSYQVNEGDTFKGAEDWSIISKTIGKLSGFLTEQTRALHVTSCFDAIEKDITDPNFKRTAERLMFLNRVAQSPEFAQILATLPED